MRIKFHFIKIPRSTRIISSTFLITIAFVFYRMFGYNLLTIFLMLATTLIAGLPIFKKTVLALRFRVIGIDALVSIAVVGAIIIGEFWEASAVTYLFMIGDYLESITLEKTRSSIKALLDLAPKKARIILDGQQFEIDPINVAKGDHVLVKPGEMIAIDGEVLEGSAYVNQSTITGESIPISRSVDDVVFSGSIIESGHLIIRADKVGEDTTFSRILQLVEQAQDKKATTQRFIEKFSKYYTPSIIILGILILILTGDTRLSLTLLVIACPGALVISTPVSVVAGIGNGAKHGILVKGGEVIEKLGKTKVIAFDKTGTLTIGQPLVTKITTYDIDEAELIKLAAVGEIYSEHPLAKAIIKKAIDIFEKITIIPEKTEIISGQGIWFKINGTSYLIGNRKLFNAHGIDISQYHLDIEAEEEKGQTVVIVGTINKVLGLISIADVVRKDTEVMIKKLRKLGIKKIVMITGDNKLAAQAIAHDLGIDGYYSHLLPEEKVKVLKELQLKYGQTVMVGDGVNDAPALASADLGIAIGGVGKDVAMETADVVLMSSDFLKLPYAIGLSRSTVRNMNQNIIFALFVAAFLLLGVLLEVVNLSIGMFVHELSVVLVILNAIRLLRYGKKYKRN